MKAINELCCNVNFKVNNKLLQLPSSDEIRNLVMIKSKITVRPNLQEG